MQPLKSEVEIYYLVNQRRKDINRYFTKRFLYTADRLAVKSVSIALWNQFKCWYPLKSFVSILFLLLIMRARLGQ